MTSCPSTAKGLNCDVLETSKEKDPVTTSQCPQPRLICISDHGQQDGVRQGGRGAEREQAEGGNAG